MPAPRSTTASIGASTGAPVVGEEPVDRVDRRAGPEPVVALGDRAEGPGAEGAFVGGHRCGDLGVGVRRRARIRTVAARARPSRKRVAWPQGPKGATMRDGLRIIDSDAHVIEPHELWTDYLDPALRHLAPRPVGLTFGFEFDDFSVNLPRQWSPDASPDELARHVRTHPGHLRRAVPRRVRAGLLGPRPARRHGPRGHRPRVPLPVVRAVRAGERRDRTEARGRHRARLQRLARRLRRDRPHPALRDGHAAPAGPGRGRGRSRAVRDRTGLPRRLRAPEPDRRSRRSTTPRTRSCGR